MAYIGSTPTVRMALSDDVSGFDSVTVHIRTPDGCVDVDGERITYRADNSLTFELTEEESRSLRRNVSMRVEARSDDGSLVVLSDAVNVYVGDSFAMEV